MLDYTIKLEETWSDFPTPDGNAVAVYMTGCVHNCINCHNKELQKHIKPIETIQEFILRLEKYCERCQTNKICIMGGDPLLPANLDFTQAILDILRYDYKIAVYTGYDIEYIEKNNITGFHYVKCGQFKQELYQTPSKTDEYFTLASRNQNWFDSNLQQLSQDGILTFN